jgi:hypothetical protein
MGTPAKDLANELTAWPADPTVIWFGVDDEDDARSEKIHLQTLSTLIRDNYAFDSSALTNSLTASPPDWTAITLGVDDADDARFEKVTLDKLADLITNWPSGIANTQTLSETIQQVTATYGQETITGATTLGPFSHSILTSQIEAEFLVQDDAETGGHALRFKPGTHSVTDCHIRFARGAGIYVPSGAVVTASGCHICMCEGPGVYVANGGKFIGNRCLIEHNTMNPTDGQVYCEDGGEIELNNCMVHHMGQSTLVNADGIARLYRTHLSGWPTYAGNVSFDRCTITVHQNEDDVLQITRPDGTVHDLRSGNNLCSIFKGAEPFYPTSSGFGPYAFESLRWVIPSSSANNHGFGAYDYIDPDVEMTADDWVISTAYRVGDVVEEIDSGDLYRCSLAGTSAGTGDDLAGGSDTGCTWAAHTYANDTAAWDDWRERQHQDGTISSPLTWRTNNADATGLRGWNTPLQMPGDTIKIYNGYAYTTPPT